MLGYITGINPRVDSIHLGGCGIVQWMDHPPPPPPQMNRISCGFTPGGIHLSDDGQISDERQFCSKSNSPM